ncbi:DNA replication and repair protein RecF [Desulfonispora thiosulfatigenes DSM 11270]|uniref:DNA replication and repair protein RecF n=1 Tax=Desulfonispora thiosulfatigenes DSM 11270 TaxID=656914 RepID=A0A1W1V2E2_DESTI|nr:DNA replication/repair protein RecF [Desulfonispora thiosulfatigenes]SMB87492.1 DNA replication and repair protein RecF [Desulfonispora thiosulfatigenes DSM 11270]
MIINKLILENYRNYTSLDINFSENINLIVGDNAQGKTNLIEAIYYLAIGKTFRGAKDKELIYFKQDFFRIKGQINTIRSNRSNELDIYYDQKKNKLLKINGVKYKKISSLFGYLHVIIFSPEDLKIIKEGPSERRRYIDIEISQLDRLYYDDLKNYYKVLTQRNNLLKEIKFKKQNKDLLELWDNQLISYGSRIIQKRMEFLKKLVPLANKIQKIITNDKESLNITYSSLVLKRATLDLGEIETVFRNSLQEITHEEIKRASSLMGPHRDDLTFYINNQELKNYGSQGQQRTAVLSLKLAEIQLFFLINGEYPVLLLDDVMSELDDSRREYLLNLIKEKNIQTFVTGANIEMINQKIEKSKIFLIEKGKIKQN